MIKKFIIIFLISITAVLAQAGYVPYDHPIHLYLERMSALNIIEGYDTFEQPKTRREIAEHLISIKNNRTKLNTVDLNILQDYLVEFSYDISLTNEYIENFFPSFNFNGLLSEGEKYLYSTVDSSKHSLFINFLGSSQSIFRNDIISSSSLNTSIIKFGGSIRGSISNKLGFYLKATNGTYLGSRDLAAMQNELKYNFKFNESQNNNELAGDYFDETEGYLMADFDNAVFKIGRDRMSLGYGNVKYMLSNNSPPIDYISMNIKYSIFSFSYFHGKLLGSETVFGDSTEGTIRTITDKYIAYHRFGLDISRHFRLGIGETVIYSRRNIDLSYLNPFNFYKSVEHQNQDRDNSMLFFDITNNSFDGLNIYATLLIDDINFGKLGTSWYGNQTLINIGIYSTLFYHYLPLDLRVQYLKVDPYVYTHRIFDNNFSNYGFTLTDQFQPNSDLIDILFSYYLNHRFQINSGFRFQRHGANELNNNGSVKVNHGGDILTGYRGGDSESASFLDGVLEYKRIFSLGINYEPINNYFLIFDASYVNENIQTVQNEYFESVFGVNVKF